MDTLLTISTSYNGIAFAITICMKNDAKLTLILSFLEIANKQIKTFPGGHTTFFSYMGIGEKDFFDFAESQSIEVIQDAINCLERDEWEWSNFIMQCES